MGCTPLGGLGGAGGGVAAAALALVLFPAIGVVVQLGSASDGAATLCGWEWRFVLPRPRGTLVGGASRADAWGAVGDGSVGAHGMGATSVNCHQRS